MAATSVAKQDDVELAARQMLQEADDRQHQTAGIAGARNEESLAGSRSIRIAIDVDFRMQAEAAEAMRRALKPRRKSRHSAQPGAGIRLQRFRSGKKLSELTGRELLLRHAAQAPC